MKYIFYKKAIDRHSPRPYNEVNFAADIGHLLYTFHDQRPRGVTPIVSISSLYRNFVIARKPIRPVSVIIVKVRHVPEKAFIKKYTKSQ